MAAAAEAQTGALAPLYHPDQCTYTACYCEENVYLLLKQLVTQRQQPQHHQHSALFAVFISNPNETVSCLLVDQASIAQHTERPRHCSQTSTPTSRRHLPALCAFAGAVLVSARLQAARRLCGVGLPCEFNTTTLQHQHIRYT